MNITTEPTKIDVWRESIGRSVQVDAVYVIVDGERIIPAMRKREAMRYINRLRGLKMKPNPAAKPKTARGGWLMHCKAGDSFVVMSTTDKLGQDERNAIVECNRRGVRVTTERVVILHGTMANPIASPAVIVTVIATSDSLVAKGS